VAGLTRRAALFAEHDRRPGAAAIELRGELGGQLARDPADLSPAIDRVDLDGVRIVRVVRIAPQLEGLAGGDGVRSQRLGVVGSRAGDAGHPKAPGEQLGRVASQIAARFAVDHLIAGYPNDATVVGVPVALVVFDVDPHASFEA